jgi:hypothetical protein
MVWVDLGSFPTGDRGCSSIISSITNYPFLFVYSSCLILYGYGL